MCVADKGQPFEPVVSTFYFSSNTQNTAADKGRPLEPVVLAL